MREWVASTRVSLLGSALVVCKISSSHHARDLTQGLGGAHSSLWSVHLPEEAVKRVVNRAHNENLWAQKEKRQARSIAHRAARERGEETPTESDSSAEDEEEGEVTSPPPSSPRIALPSFCNITSQ
jgi:hypothetical protein